MPTAKIEREAAARGEGPLGKAADDEPVFLLRAQDALAAGIVDMWATMALQAGVGKEKVREAVAIAKAMRQWPNRRMPD